MREHAFSDLPPTPGAHFRLHFYAAVAWLAGVLAARLRDRRPIQDRFPFLEGYLRELQRCGPARLDPSRTAAWWRDAVAAWEDACPCFLPIRAVRNAAGIGYDGIATVFTVGLVDEDARFAQVFDALDGLQARRPTVGLLVESWDGARDGCDARALVEQLRRVGLLQVLDAQAPRTEWALQVPPAVWDALRGDGEGEVPWARYCRPASQLEIDRLVLPNDVRAQVTALPSLLDRDPRPLVVRGPRRNGRRTMLGAVARALGRGVLDASALGRTDDDRWQQLGLLAVARHAMPVLALDLGPGDTVEIPAPGVYDGPMGVVLGRQGGVTGPLMERALVLTLDVPAPAQRREHWQRGLGDTAGADLDVLAERFRLTSGHIRRAGDLARSYAALARGSRSSPGDALVHEGCVTADHVRQATRSLNREALDALASRLPDGGDWAHLAVRDDTLRELMDLELRCRHRERLAATAGQGLGAGSCGVRALFRGPSGTGKTLAARLLASMTGTDLYRLDLSALVNKYIGETEKNLDRVLSRAEELGVMLLLDEGDALLTQRTGVQTSNDRYANLETNYLLQRLESFDGVLIVTTNAGDRIDAAFERRMDVVIDFRAPDASERWDIWQLHLPATHRVDPDLLNDIASRCVMSGGQIRNAVLHASLLALDGGGPILSAHVDAAVRREYRKAGGVCPLRRPDLPAWATRA